MQADLARLQRYATSRDPDAFAALVRTYAGMVFAVAKRITRDVHDAEDVVQSCFLSLATHAGQVSSNVAGWLHRTATRRALDIARDRRQVRQRERSVAKPEAETADDQWAQILPVIDAAIDELPDDLKAPLILHYLQARSQEQIANELGVNQSTISRRLEKAIAQIREALTSQGLSAAVIVPAGLAGLGPQTLPAALSQSLVKIGIAGIESVKPVASVSVLSMLPAIVATLVVGGGILLILQLRTRTSAGTPATTAPTATAQPVAAAATLPTTTPATRPTAAELVADLRKSEEWIDKVHSFYIELDGRYLRSPESIASRTTELRRDFPNMPMNEQTFPELRAVSPDKTRIAFDDKRVMQSKGTEGKTLRITVWDGQKQISRFPSMDTRQDDFRISPTIDRHLELFNYEQWPPRAFLHDFWWEKQARATSDSSESTPGPDRSAILNRLAILDRLRSESAVMGPVQYRGEWCWVLALMEQSFVRWYVGVDDHRLHGTQRGYVTSDDTWEKVCLAAHRKVAERHGSKVNTIDEFHKWSPSYTNHNQEKYERLMGEVNAEVGLPDLPARSETWTTDYREVAPGCWLPFQQGWLPREIKNGKVIVDNHHEQTVVSVKVNEPLPDDLFAIQMVEGAEVYDHTYSPPLSYKWKKDRTQQEWQEIFEQARRQQAESKAMQTALEKMIGEPAPAFPAKAEWLNGESLSWEKLRGKIVILDFFAEWCGPCNNDLPALVDIYAKSKETGIVVIGVHTPGSADARVREHLKSFHIDYPVIIDAPPPSNISGYGAMSGAFGVTGIPQLFVVGPDGVVEGQGSVEHVMKIATQLRKSSTDAATQPAGK